MSIITILEEQIKQKKEIKLLMELKKNKERELKEIRIKLRKLIQK